MKLYIITIAVGFLMSSACTRENKPKGTDSTPPVATQADLNKAQEQVENKINQQLEQNFKGSAPIDQKASRAMEITGSAEPETHSALNSLEKEKSLTFSEKEILPLIAEVEQNTQKQALQLMEQEFDKAQTELNGHTATLNQKVKASYALLEVPIQPLQEPDTQTLSEYHKEHIDKPAQTALEAKYLPHELALVQKLQPVALEGTPSVKDQIPSFAGITETDTLQIVLAIYMKVHNAQPYHEQGQIARALALSALEIMDEKAESGVEDSATATATATATDSAIEKETREKQELSYQISLALMLNMGADVFEESELSNKESRRKWGESIYEILSGRHFLTGLSLTDDEKAVRLLDSAYVVTKNNWPTLTAVEEPAPGGNMKEKALEKTLTNLSAVLTQIHSHAKEKSSLIEGDSLAGIGPSAHNMLAVMATQVRIENMRQNILFLIKHFKQQQQQQSPYEKSGLGPYSP